MIDGLEEMMHVTELKDGTLMLDGMPLKAVEEYDIHHELGAETTLTVKMAVMLKGIDITEEAATKATAPSNGTSIDRIADAITSILKREYGSQNEAQKSSIQFP